MRHHSVSPSYSCAHSPPVLQLNILKLHPQLKGLVRQALEQATQEFVLPTKERVMKVASTVEELVRKDFALDGEEGRMKHAGQSMARYIASALTQVMSQESMVSGMAVALKNTFLNRLGGQVRNVVLVYSLFSCLALVFVLGFVLVFGCSFYCCSS